MLLTRNTQYATGILLLWSLVSAVYATEKITLCIHPYKSASELYKAFSPLAVYLGQAAGIEVEVLVTKDYDSHIEHIIKNKTGIAYLGPASYVKLVDMHGKPSILARLSINGKPTFQGKIVVRDDSPIQSLSNLQGKRFAFGDPNSTMSHLVPRYMLIEAGITADRLADFRFLGNHVNVALSVLSGKFDAGAVKEAVFHKYQSRGLRALATTPALSEHLFIASDDLSPELIELLRSTFYNMKDDADGIKAMKSIKSNITAMVSADDADYDNLRLILATLRDKGVIE